jgi:hypothetical protein
VRPKRSTCSSPQRDETGKETNQNNHLPNDCSTIPRLGLNILYRLHSGLPILSWVDYLLSLPHSAVASAISLSVRVEATIPLRTKPLCNMISIHTSRSTPEGSRMPTFALVGSVPLLECMRFHWKNLLTTKHREFSAVATVNVCQSLTDAEATQYISQDLFTFRSKVEPDSQVPLGQLSRFSILNR